MSIRDYSVTLGRLRALLERGPVPAETHSATARARRGLRAAVLRALSPYSRYQDEVNTVVLTILVEHEHDRHRIRRLERLAEDLIGSVESLRRRAVPVEAIRAELNAVPYVADAPFEQFQSSVGEVTGYRSLDCGIAEPSPYAAFEDLFRGPEERVRELQRPYVSLVAANQPVLDVGCGRGEFLALLASQGIDARGVDRDPGMVERCRARGLAAVPADANEHLDGLEDGSLGAIFSAQVIEHLSADELRGLLDLSRHKLKPGGVFIAETINPHSVPALKTFWVDPTHQHPIFPEVALALCAIAGFCPAYVFAPGYTKFERAKFESTSYAVVASSPANAALSSQIV